MSHFVQKFGLQVGQSLSTRARSENCCGWSDWSALTQGVTLVTSPAVPEAPIMTKMTQTSFTVAVQN
jgi:hypothetical protein